MRYIILLALGLLPALSSGAPLVIPIDRWVNAAITEGEFTPAPVSSDAEFLRRVTLDLTGQIPSVTAARAFLDDPRADKRSRLVDALLASPGSIHQSAQRWRALLVPQATTNPQTQQLGVSVEAWVREQLRLGLRDDEIVRRLLSTRLDYLDFTADGLPMPAPGLSPLGFFQANDLKPETVGSAVARTFMGLKLECALCHDHPFDKWTQQQAWQTAAFFAGVSPLSPDAKPSPGLANRRELKITDSETVAVAKFLNGDSPNWKSNDDPRAAFGQWLTAPGNAYFAPAMVNRIWASLFGVGLVEPVDDWGPHNPPSHPELLDALAKAYISSGFDANAVTRAIVLSDAYQRSSRTTPGGENEPRLFAAMNVKGLSAEQLFDSVSLATGYRDATPRSGDLAFGWPARSPRGLFIAKFGSGAGRTDQQVSILQALSLMNGAFMTEQTSAATGRTVRAVALAPYLSDAEQLEILYLATLSRRPNKAESERHMPLLRETEDRAEMLGDLLWVLLNSHEFLVNH